MPWVSPHLHARVADRPADCFAAAFELGERDWESALVDLFFAASMNDSLAQMALGYRYKYGLGVQKNCSAALLYYKEVAEAVVSLAEHSTLFPKVCLVWHVNNPLQSCTIISNA